jgi:hypothetical protein
MARSRKQRAPHVERHVRLYHYIMKTAAWGSLSCVARCIFIEIEKRYGGPGSNNGKIHYSIREAATALHIGKTTAANGFKELQDRGFVVLTKAGGFNRKDRHANEWRLTTHASDISQDSATKEFLTWKPGDVTEEKNTVPQRGPSVPEPGQHGISTRTMAA